jgi:hypothetical protein
LGPGRKKLPAESNGSMTLDNKWYGNCNKRGHCRLNFLHQCSQSREGTQQYLIGLHQVSCTLIWLQVIVFWGPYRFTSFGVLSQHNWTLLYQSSLRLYWPHPCRTGICCVVSARVFRKLWAHPEHWYIPASDCIFALA